MRPKPGKLGGDKPDAGKLKKPIKPPGRDFEDKTAKRFKDMGGRRQKGSGSYVGRPADMTFLEPESLLTECKDFPTREVAIPTKWLRKITREARGVRKTPMLVVRVNVTPPTPKEWGMLPLDTIEKLLRAAGWEGLE